MPPAKRTRKAPTPPVAEQVPEAPGAQEVVASVEEKVEPETAQPEVVPINVALVRAAADIGAVAKNLRNEQAGYAARSIDDVLDAVHDPLARHGIIPTFTVEKHRMKARTSRGGGAIFHVTIRVRYRFTGPAGDSLDVVNFGEATDTSDKATNKALSAAYKMTLIQVFTIPITGDKDDADSTTNEIDAAPARQQVNEADEAKARDGGWKDVAEAKTAVDALRERVAALPNDGTSEAFTAWRADNGVAWPWPKAWVEAASAEVDRLTDPGPVDPALAASLAAEAAASKAETEPCEECHVEPGEPHVYDCTIAARSGAPTRPDPFLPADEVTVKDGTVEPSDAPDPAPGEPESASTPEAGEAPPEPGPDPEEGPPV